MLWIVLLIGDDEGKQRDCLPSSRGHFQDTMAAREKGPLEIAHVGILLGIDLRIGEENRQVTVKVVSKDGLQQSARTHSM